MIDERPDIVEAYMRDQSLALGALGLRAHLPSSWPTWPWGDGANLLICWSGERLPIPSLNPWDDRSAIIVGFVYPDQEQIDTYGDFTPPADTVYWFTMVQLGGGGADSAIDVEEIQPRVTNGSAEWLGLLPNAPASLHASFLPGLKPRFSWVYSRFNEQVQPDHFAVFESIDAAAFNFASPVATVAFNGRGTRYEWIGAGLSAGDVRHYTVRAVSAKGVSSLIPRLGRAPSPDYDDVGLARCPKLVAPRGPTAINNLWLGVV